MMQQPLTEATVREALAAFKDPETGRSITQLGQVHRLDLDGAKLAVGLGLTSWAAPIWEDTRRALADSLRERFPDRSIDVTVEPHERPAPSVGETGLKAKSVIAVGSGKGGVGKSSIAVILAHGLRRAGCKVGLMDADVYGPSIPHLIGSQGRPVLVGEKIQPVEVRGIKVMSIGFFVPTGEAIIWRGPMLHGAMKQFLHDTDWGELDYLIIDMPPGTGDIPLSLSQLLPLTGAIIVCTPQDVALLDAVRAIAMLGKVGIEVLGMIENMSYFICPGCGARHDIFGAGGARQQAAASGVPFLGEVPIDIQLRILGDKGKTADVFDRDDARRPLESICRNLVWNLAENRRREPAVPKLSVLRQ